MTQALAPVVGTLPAKPGLAPGIAIDQDSARTQAMKLYREKGIPFLERLLDSVKVSDRIKLDAVKELRSVALPPPQVVVGDVEVTIIVDL